MSEQNTHSHSVYKWTNLRLNMWAADSDQGVLHSGKTQGKISRQVDWYQCAVSKCLQGNSFGNKKCGRKRVTTKRDDRKLAKLVRSDWVQKCGEIASSGMLMICLHRDQQAITE